MPKIKITALYVYPVKSLAGVKVNHLKFDRFGPEFDRRWMIVDECGNCLTQREITKMALIKVNFDAEYLYLSYADQIFKLEFCATKSPIMAQVWKHRGEMLDCGDSVAEFLSAILKVKCRLVTINSQHTRISSEVGSPAISLVDARQVLIASTESLAWLNQKLAENDSSPINMNRFRANIILSGGQGAFYENLWQNLTIGEINLRREKACGRCMIITTDQETGQLSNNLPLKILAKYNRDDKQKGAAFGTYFNAQNLTGSLYQDDIIQIHTYTDLVKQDNIL